MSSGNSQVHLSSPGLVAIESAPPKEFGGPGDKWSPETLLTAAIADCFILSFHAVAAASGEFSWRDLTCTAESTLDRVDKITRMVRIELTATLTISTPEATEKGKKLLDKAESVCLISNSLNAEIVLNKTVLIAE